ncbi:hypothetical protein CH063_16039, partial [Colletotrichum higginsianum]
MAPWTKPESSPASNGQPSRATDERTPLLQVDEPTTPLPITQQDADAIPPNDFDILLSRSLPTSGPFLEPEST